MFVEELLALDVAQITGQAHRYACAHGAIV